MTRKHLLARATALTLLAFGSAAHAQSAEASDAWSWNVITYLWASDIKTEANVRGQPVSNEIEFSDIVDHMDIAQQIHVEGQGRDWGVMTDLTYLKASGEGDFPNMKVETDLTTVMLDAALVWSPGEEQHTGLELMGGVRYLSVDVEADFDITDPNQPDQKRGLDNSFTDALIGARYGAPLSDKWSYSVRGDASFGQTDGTWSATAALQYRLKRGRLFMGYRHYVVDLTSERGLAVKQTMSGPLIAYSFNFRH